jgi:ParB-like chromosome segregation protein Spo0J
MPAEMIVHAAPLADLRPHPEQERIYGPAGGPHDPYFGEFVATVRASGIRTPLLVSRGTPGLPDGTIISGHRRLAAAGRLGHATVPVLYERFESADHARRAHLECNRQRVKDEWVKTREAAAWWDVEAELASVRKAEGRESGGKARHQLGGAGATKLTSTAKTRDVVARKMGEGGKTTELRRALLAKAQEQNPADIDASPIACDLKANVPVKTVARKHGVKGAPPRKERAARADEFDAIAAGMRAATTQHDLEMAFGRHQHADALTESQRQRLADLYRERSAAFELPPLPRKRSRRADSLCSAIAGIEKRYRDIRNSAAAGRFESAEERRDCLAALDRVGIEHAALRAEIEAEGA